MGPFLPFQQEMLKLSRKKNNDKYSAEELSTVSLAEVKQMIEEQVPDAFAKNGQENRGTQKKAPTKRQHQKALRKIDGHLFRNSGVCSYTISPLNLSSNKKHVTPG